MACFENNFEEEFNLARQMQAIFCNESGKETNAAEAGAILHKIGRVYRKRSPDKISIIKSVGLFNAAIFRNPSNITQVQSDLSEICQHTLQQAKAQMQDADLVKKADQIKLSIQELRNNVEVFLKNSVPKIPETSKKAILKELQSRKISAIKLINNVIASAYTHVMADLAQFCQNVMGKQPCEYALVGMGSLARQEITPYSDFEHIILLFDDESSKSHLEYFRWFSVIFHVVILNLQETIIPSLNINSLNESRSKLGDWYYDAITPRGISFDGMMPHACKFPLGRYYPTENKKFVTELIKPVSEMLEHLSSDMEFKNGYHLADILTKTCFVYGNKNIFNKFCDGVYKYRVEKSLTQTFHSIQQQVKNDLDSFSTRFRLTNLKAQNKINIKQLIFRSTTIFISALGRLYKISANSSFDIIDEMVKNNKISSNSGVLLQYAIAIACEMRLRVYTENGSQCDTIIDMTQDSKNSQKFLDILGVASTINYFQIAYCLQCEVAKQLNLAKSHFYCEPQLINFIIGFAFNIEVLSTTKLPRNFTWDVKKFDFDTCMEQLETNTNLSRKQRCADQITSVADSLYSAEIPDDAIDLYKELLRIYESKPRSKNRDRFFIWTSDQIGCCLLSLDQYTKAHQYLIQSLQLKQNISLDAAKDKDIAISYYMLSRCKFHLHQYDDALKYLKHALEIYQNISVDAAADREIAAIFDEIGHCLMQLQEHNQALNHFNCSRKILETTAVDPEKDVSLSMTLNNYGYHLMNLHQYHSSLHYLKRAHIIALNTLEENDNNLIFSTTLTNIGRCLIGLKQYDKAWKCLEQSLQIKRSKTLDEGKDHCIAYSYNCMGECLMRKQQYANAHNYFQKSLKIYESITINVEKDKSLADILSNNGFCMMKTQQYSDAAICFKRSLATYAHMSLNQFTATTVEKICSALEQCLRKI